MKNVIPQASMVERVDNAWPSELQAREVSPFLDEAMTEQSTARSEIRLLQVPVVSTGGSVADPRGSTVNSSAESAAVRPAAVRRSFYNRSAEVKTDTAKPKQTSDFYGYSHGADTELEQAGNLVDQLQTDASAYNGLQNDQAEISSADRVHFHDMYAKLCVFKNTYKHTNVPKVTTWFLLGSWVEQLRKRRKVQSLKERGINVATDLPPLGLDQIQMLDAIGFCWQVPSSNENKRIIAAIKDSKEQESEGCTTEDYSSSSTQSVQDEEPPADEQMTQSQPQGQRIFPAPASFPPTDSFRSFPEPRPISNDSATTNSDAYSMNRDGHPGLNYSPMGWNYNQAQSSDDGFSNEYSSSSVNQCDDLESPRSFTTTSMQDDRSSQAEEGYGNQSLYSSHSTFNAQSSSPSEVYSSHQSVYSNQFDTQMKGFNTIQSSMTSKAPVPQAFNGQQSMSGHPQYSFGVPASASLPSEVYSSQQSVCSNQFGSHMQASAPSDRFSCRQSSYSNQYGSMAAFVPSEAFSNQSVYSHSNQSVDFNTTRSTNSDRFKQQVEAVASLNRRALNSAHVQAGKKRKGAPGCEGLPADLERQSAMSCSSCVSRSSRDGNAEQIWHMQFKNLLEFKKKNKHCSVPARYTDDPKLGHWVMTQRRQYHLMKKGKPTRMTPSRIEMLQKAGFQWSVRKDPTEMWNMRLQELVEYKRVHGDCLVPQRYSVNPQLGTWVNTQRRHYKLLKEGKRSCMTKERLQKLVDVGFTWSTHTLPTRDEDEEAHKFLAYMRNGGSISTDGTPTIPEKV